MVSHITGELPERELAPAFSQHLSVRETPSDGPARVLLGRSGEAVSPIDAPPGVNYSVVELKAEQRGVTALNIGYHLAFLLGAIAAVMGCALAVAFVSTRTHGQS